MCHVFVLFLHTVQNGNRDVSFDILGTDIWAANTMDSHGYVSVGCVLCGWIVAIISKKHLWQVPMWVKTLSCVWLNYTPNTTLAWQKERRKVRDDRLLWQQLRCSFWPRWHRWALSDDATPGNFPGMHAESKNEFTINRIHIHVDQTGSLKHDCCYVLHPVLLPVAVVGAQAGTCSRRSSTSAISTGNTWEERQSTCRT